MEESSLLQRAQRFEPDALRELHVRFYGPVYRYLYFRLTDPARAEELAGDVFVAVMVQLKKGHGWRTTPQAWIFGIARNMTADHFRRLARQGSEVPFESLAGDLSDNGAFRAVGAELFDLHEALALLTEDYHEVVVLRFMERLQIRETAEVMGRTPLAIKALQHRALKRLAELLNPEQTKPLPTESE